MRWPNGLSAPEDLGFMGSGQYSVAYGINDLGEIVGVADNGECDTRLSLAEREPTGTWAHWRAAAGHRVAYVINNSTVIAGSSNGGYPVFCLAERRDDSVSVSTRNHLVFGLRH